MNINEKSEDKLWDLAQELSTKQYTVSTIMDMLKEAYELGWNDAEEEYEDLCEGLI